MKPAKTVMILTTVLITILTWLPLSFATHSEMSVQERLLDETKTQVVEGVHATQKTGSFLPQDSELIDEPYPVMSNKLPEGTSSDWWSTVRKTILDSEYHVTWQDKTFIEDTDAAWQAPNRSNNLRTYFTEDGIRVIPRTSEKPEWSWGLSLEGYGYQGDVKAVDKAEMFPDKNRMEYKRGADLTEWYINAQKGLEQGFTLNAPAGSETKAAEKDQWIVLRMALHGNLKGAIDVGKGKIDLLTPDGAPALQYKDLHAFDDTGRELPVTMALTENNVDILVDTTDAVYPLTVDPTVEYSGNSDWHAVSNKADAHMGSSVSTAGDVNGDGYSDVIVGASNYDNGQVGEGRVYVYHGSANGLEGIPAWYADGNQEKIYFGHSVSTAGDVNGDGFTDVIIGAIYYSHTYTKEGRAYVYHGSPSGLSELEDPWTVQSGQAEAFMGSSVSAAGDVNGDGYADVIIGAGRYDHGENNEGRVYLYLGSETGLDKENPWTAEPNVADTGYGYSVSTAGDVNGDGYSDVIVGAHHYTNGEANEGRAYLYYGSKTGLVEDTDWNSESNQTGALFGFSVSTAGDVNGDGYADVIIGTPDYNLSKENEGAFSIYHGSEDGISKSSGSFFPSQVNARMGYSVSTAGDVNGDGYADVIVGAYRYDTDPVDGVDAGRVWVYFGSKNGVTPHTPWILDVDQAGALLGYSVSTAGDVNGDGYSDIIAGTFHYQKNYSREGGAFVVHGSANGLGKIAGSTADSDQVNSEFGISISTAGDVNGDGFADIIVGAPYYDNGQQNEGRAFVYHGAEFGLSQNFEWMAEANQGYAGFAESVATAGDVNGDGFADVIVGIPGYDNGMLYNVGRAVVFYGSPTGLSTTADWTAESDQSNSGYGESVSAAGDVNGDGYSDVIVGASSYNYDQISDGRVFVYHGSSTGLNTTADWTADSGQSGSWFGYSVSMAGDVNGDGYSDVIIGARDFSNGQTREGRAFVYHGSPSGLNAVANWFAEADQEFALFGTCVSTAGDVNGDSYADVIIEATSSSTNNQGLAFVYHGSAGGLHTTADWTVEIPSSSWTVGHRVSTAGDVNGDGFADVIVGAYNPERAMVHHGSAAGLSTSADWTVETDLAGSWFGFSVATAGDVNGDGYSDVIVGASHYDNSQVKRCGRVFVYYGNDGPGKACHLTQRQANNSTPIAHLGMSDRTDSFQIDLKGRTPFGRGQVKLQWEVKPLGTLFDGTGTGQSSAWSDTGTDGVSLAEIISGLAPNTYYHWRVRLLWQDPAALFSPYSRWMTMPWNGWEEADFRTMDIDSDGDGLIDEVEIRLGTNPDDADTDDDGIPDGVENADRDTVVDANETDPLKTDTDGDFIQDGTEKGYTLDDVGPDTNRAVFRPDQDDTTTTDPLDDDTDNDRLLDGEEDINLNGKIDPGESDPGVNDNSVEAMPFIPLLLLGE